MRRITREKASPVFWEKGKARLRLKKYDDLNDTEAGAALRNQLRQHMIQTQRGLCAYCCKKITMDDSLNEHIQPKAIYPKRSLDYGNLLASCTEKTTCGMKKGNAYDALFVSPLQEDCEGQFTFAPDGSIIGLTPGARYTCILLNLNSFELRRARKAVWRVCEGFHDKEMIRKYYLYDDEGDLRAFADVIAYYFQN